MITSIDFKCHNLISYINSLPFFFVANLKQCSIHKFSTEFSAKFAAQQVIGTKSEPGYFKSDYIRPDGISQREPCNI